MLSAQRPSRRLTHECEGYDEQKNKIKLKSGASIGEPAAEDDHAFLADCFVNHPIVDAMKEVSSPQCVLLGRTGAGKSAIMWHLEDTLENVSRLDPREMAFQYLGNSAIIQQIAELGVNLHTLYEYLWTHTLTLHICRECLGANTQQGLNGIVDKIKGVIWRDQKRETAVKYLEKHANNFWLDVENISSEITKSISEKLATEAGLSPEVLKVKMEAGWNWKEEQKRAFRYRAQEVVSSLQIRELKETINALAYCIESKKSYYIIIDDLDTDLCGNEETQYALMRALIESLKTFRRVPRVKIIVAMREDLYEATLRTTTDKHFQAEKLEGIIKRIRWTDNLLLNLIDRRIQQLFRHSYTTQVVGLSEVMATEVARSTTSTYLLNRTLRRPRDIIAFINKILTQTKVRIFHYPPARLRKWNPFIRLIDCAHSRMSGDPAIR